MATDSSYDDEELDYSDDPDPNTLYDCPVCSQELDDIDYEYQICHLCGWGKSRL